MPKRVPVQASLLAWASLALKNTHISASRQNFKNLIGNFLGINLTSLLAKFQPCSFKNEGGV